MAEFCKSILHYLLVMACYGPLLMWPMWLYDLAGYQTFVAVVGSAATPTWIFLLHYLGITLLLVSIVLPLHWFANMKWLRVR